MRKFSAALLITLMASSAPALCKSDDEKKIEKTHALVDQIIQAVKDERPNEEERTALKTKCHERIDRMVDVIADKAHLSDDEKAKLKARIAEGKEAHKSGKGIPPELKEKLEKKFDRKAFCLDATYKVLGDHLSDSELKSLLKFIKSKTGKTILKQMPDMMAQSVELSVEHFVPIIMDMCKDFFKMPPGLGPNADPEKKREMMEKLRQMIQEHMRQTKPPTGSGKDET